MDRPKKIRKRAVGVVGLPGAGKSIVSEVGKEINVPTLTMGNIIRQICLEKGLLINSKNLGECMLEVRKEEGMDAVAKRTLLQISEIKENILIIDGLRSYEEVELFRKNLQKFYVIAIHASPRTRYARIRRRQRYDDPRTFEEFRERDFREINTGIAKILALADIIFVNEGKIRYLKKRIRKILQLIREGRWR